MSIEQVVVNTSPLIVFYRSGQAELLRDLFGSVVVPSQVIEEIEAGPAHDPAKVELGRAEWIEVKKVTIPNTVAGWNLGEGESGVFSYALQYTNCLAVVDDLAARRCAKAFSIPTIGSGGTLVIAKQRGLINSVMPRIQRLQDAGLYLSNEVVNTIASEVHETPPY